jgi:hypothetical protein
MDIVYKCRYEIQEQKFRHGILAYRDQFRGTAFKVLQ